MKQKKLIAPSVLSADFGHLAGEVRAVDLAGADWIHVDVMDGHFVPNITIGPLVVSAIRKATKKLIDVHLMIENPERYVTAFAQAGANLISIHMEEGYHLDRTLNLIRENKCKAGIALNPATPIESVFPILDKVHFVLIMTVNPGFGGQKFIGSCREKIKKLHKEIDRRGLKTLIEIDGGVKTSNLKELSALGVDVFVAGSAIFGTRDYGKTIAKIREKIV